MGLSAIRSPGLKTISPINFGTLLIKPAFVHRSLEMLYREQILSNMHDKLHMSPRKGILIGTGAFKIIMVCPFFKFVDVLRNNSVIFVRHTIVKQCYVWFDVLFICVCKVGKFMKLSGTIKRVVCTKSCTSLLVDRKNSKKKPRHLYKLSKSISGEWVLLQGK